MEDKTNEIWLVRVEGDSDTQDVQQMIKRAQGDVTAFRELYEIRFNCAPALVTEKILAGNSVKGTFIPINPAALH